LTIRSLNKLRPGDIATLGDGAHSDAADPWCPLGLRFWRAKNRRPRSFRWRAGAP